MLYRVCRRNALLRLCHYLCSPGLSTRRLHWVSYLGVSITRCLSPSLVDPWVSYLGVSVTRCLSPSLVDHVVCPRVYYLTRPVLWLSAPRVVISLWCGSASLPVTSSRVVYRCVCRGNSGCAVYAACTSVSSISNTPPRDWSSLGGPRIL